MQLDTVLTRFESLLDEEQKAIRQVEAAHLARLAEEKVVLMRLLRTGGITEHDDLIPRFEQVVAALRHNLVLLSHAKACVRDVIALTAPPPATYQPTGRPVPAASGGRLSVSG